MAARRKGKLTTNELIGLSLRLQESVAAAPGHRVDRERLLDELGVDEAQLAQLIAYANLPADRATGARPCFYEAGAEVVLLGDAGELDPLRLSAEESILLGSLLDRGGTELEEPDAVLEELTSPGTQQRAVESSEYFGPFFALLSEAIEYGIRCRIDYRSEGDAEARERTIDPGSLAVEGGSAYLTAWDTQADGQRRYRLDRISGARFTEESVEPHPFETESIPEHLAGSGSKAVLRFPSLAYLERLEWAGAQPHVGNPDQSAADGGDSIVATVTYSRESWLFDQVLAGGGDIVIVSPAELRPRFLSYARSLLD